MINAKLSLATSAITVIQKMLTPAMRFVGMDLITQNGLVMTEMR